MEQGIQGIEGHDWKEILKDKGDTDRKVFRGSYLQAHKVTGADGVQGLKGKGNRRHLRWTGTRDRGFKAFKDSG
jgi:hypothetical protein